MKKGILAIILSVILYGGGVAICQITELEGDTLGLSETEISSPELSDEELRELFSTHSMGYSAFENMTLNAFEGDALNFRDLTWALDIDGNVAYVLCTDYLYSVDINDLTDMSIIDGCYLGTNCSNIEVRGNFAFITQNHGIYDSDLLLVDISQPTDLVSLGSIYHTTLDQFRAIDLEGNIAYIACRYRLISLDIQDLASVSLLGYTSGCQLSKDIEVDGNFAYVSGSHTYVFNVSIPTSPTFITTIYTGMAWSIAIDGDYLYSASYYSGLQIWYIQDPGLPLWKSTTSTGVAYPCGIVVMGDWCYLTLRLFDHYGQINAYDVSDPACPVFVDAQGYDDGYLFRAHAHGQTWVLSVSGLGDPYSKLRSMRVATLDGNLAFSPTCHAEP